KPDSRTSAFYRIGKFLKPDSVGRYNANPGDHYPFFHVIFQCVTIPAIDPKQTSSPLSLRIDTLHFNLPNLKYTFWDCTVTFSPGNTGFKKVTSVDDIAILLDGASFPDK